MKSTNIIGILSGSGPEAGLDLVHEMHQYLQEEYGAVDDQDYPKYLLYNCPLAGFGMTGIEDYDSVVREFVDAMQYLCDIGVGSIAIACNTLHLLLNTLDTSVRDRVVSIVDAAVAQVSSGSSVLILSSSTSRALRLYDKALDDGGVAQIQYVSDQDQQIIDHCIRAVMGSTDIAMYTAQMHNIIDLYRQEYAVDTVLLGCTEIPLLVETSQIPEDVVCINATQALAQVLVDTAKGCLKQTTKST